MKNITYILVAVLGLFHTSEGYKILAMFPIPSKSHHNLAVGVVKALLQAGHEVTQVTPYPDKDLPPNLKQLDISGSDMGSIMEDLNVTRILNGETAMDLTMMVSVINVINRDVLTNQKFQNFLSDTKQTFDVVISVWALSDSYIGLKAVFDCPFIWFSTIEPHSVILNLIDESTNPAYVPNGQSSNVPPYDFKERLKEFFSQFSYNVLEFFYLNNYYNQLFAEAILPHVTKRGKPAIEFSDVKYNASLVLGNSHVSVGLPIRLPQAYKAVGGYHIEPEVKPLPQDLKKLLDKAKNGLVYFSMGSILKSKDLPEQLKQDFLEVLGSLKQTVIWKFEEVLPNLPPNVHIVNWAPQPSILAHSNCILFITHGGLLSTTEAVHFGKPIVGIPVFGDQFSNIDRAVKKGFALRVNLAYDMKDKLKAAIEEAVVNKRYSEKAKELSLIYHDRPVPPSKELVHWVEHVIKTKGAPHLRSPALNIPVYQKLYLDLLALIVVVLYALKMIVVKTCCSRKTVDKKKKNL